MNCIFDDYIKFVENFLSNYFRILLEGKYERRLVRPLIDKYISVKYYNDCVVLDKKFTVRLNKELNMVAKDIIRASSKDKTEKVKNVFALFSYILFIENCDNYTELNAIIKSLFADKAITLTYGENTRDELNALAREYISKRNEFYKLFDSKDFHLECLKYNNNLFIIRLEHDFNISKLYSDYAIERAYNSEVVTENKVYLALLMISAAVLKDALDVKYDNNYAIDFPSSLFDKPKKILKFIKVIDNDYLKTKVNLRIKYQDYKKYKKQINSLINEGFSFCLILDEAYDMDFSCLLLFTYIFVDAKSKYYDIIINSKDNIKSTLVTLRGE